MSKNNRKTAFLLGFLFLIYYGVQAQIVNVYNVSFATTKKHSMWKDGEAFSLDFDYPLFNEGWNIGDELDLTETICGKRFGIGLEASSKGSMGMNFYLNGLTSGSIDAIVYPLEIGFITPDPSTIKAGQTIRIDSYYKVTGTPFMKTSYPTGGRLGLRFHFDMDNHIDFEGCAFSCASTNLNINLDLDTTLFQISAHEGETFYLANGTKTIIPPFLCIEPPAIPYPEYQRKDFLPVHVGGGPDDCNCCDSTFVCDSCDCVENCPDIDCDNDGKPDNGTFALSNYIEGDLDIPYIAELQTTIVNDNTIRGKGSDKFITASFDPINALLNYSPYKLKGDVKIPSPVSCLIGIDYNILSASIDFNIYNKQSFDFTAEAFAILELPVKVDYQIKNQQDAIVNTGKDSIIEYKIGNYVMFKFPCEYQFMDFKPEIYIKNKLTNRTYNDYELEVPIEAMELKIEFKKIVIIPEITIDIWIPFDGWETITTPEVAFDPPDKNIGPLWEDVFPIGHIEHTIFKKSWSIDDFPNIKTPAFRIEPQRFKLNLNPVAVACNSAATGQIILNDSGGTHPLTYEWSNGDTTRDLQQVKAGEYYVKSTDANNCAAFNGATINEPEPLSVVSDLQHCNCFGDNTGAIYLSVKGGVKPYSFLWSNGQTTENLTNIASGTYIYQVIDAHNCIFTDTLIITHPTQLFGYISDFGTPLCNGSTEGYVKINVSGGTPPYRYQWSNFAVTQNIDSLQAGVYSVTVTDFNQCAFEANQIIPEPELLQNQFTVDPVKCYKGSDGTLEAAISGGTPPYFITWYSPEYTLNNRTNRLENLSEGLYQIEIYDSNLCFLKDSIWVSAPNSPFFTELKTTNPSCPDGNDGAITLTVRNGTAPYTYRWSNNSETQSISGLNAGKYDVTVWDFYFCQTQNNTVLIEPLAFKADAEVKRVSCLEETDGQIEIILQGGTPPYEVFWSNNESGTKIENLPKGSYNATITDRNNCSFFYEVVVPVNGVGCLDIPSAFTPNGDNYNDTWVIRSIKNYPKHKIKVFTKWGELIYANTGNYEPWDGTHHGNDCPAATYYYIVDLGNGEPLYKGLVTIVR